MNTQNKSTVIFVGLTTLVIGVALGVVGAESHNGTLGAVRTGGSPTNPPAGTALASPNLTGPAEWNPFQEIRNMQAQMDQMFSQISGQIRLGPQAGLFRENPGYSFSLNVQDLKDRYEVHAYVPDTKVSDVNVSLQNNQTLKVEVSNKNTETSNQKSAETSVTSWGQYEQTVQLPTPVKADQMKVERKDHELLITLPKAAGSNP